MLPAIFVQLKETFLSTASPYDEFVISQDAMPTQSFRGAHRDSVYVCVHMIIVCSYILPPFLFTPRISFGQSQALQILTKFIDKNINIYNNKSILLDSLLNVFSHRIDFFR